DDAPLDLARDRGVDEAVQPRERRAIREHDAAERATIDRPVGRDDTLAEGLDDRRVRLRARPVHLVSDLVGVDDLRAELAEDARDGAFPGSDASGEADHE